MDRQEGVLIGIAGAASSAILFQCFPAPAFLIWLSLRKPLLSFLLNSRHGAKHWGYSHEEDASPAFEGPGIYPKNDAFSTFTHSQFISSLLPPAIGILTSKEEGIAWNDFWDYQAEKHSCVCN